MINVLTERDGAIILRMGILYCKTNFVHTKFLIQWP